MSSCSPAPSCPGVVIQIENWVLYTLFLLPDFSPRTTATGVYNYTHAYGAKDMMYFDFIQASKI